MNHAQPCQRHVQTLSLCAILLSGMATGSCGGGPATTLTTTDVSAARTNANLELGDRERRDGRFVGLAISGGGSRAAVFGGAVLMELERLGLLQQLDVVSAVSGGALPAAYYALDGFRTIDLSNGFMEQMGRDFQSEVRGRWLAPGNVLKYWFTNTTRADTVVEILDEELFHGATYADLNPARPKLLLNAANALNGDPFIITDESFASLGSSLAPFSVARAVYVSAAYPGVLEPVLLRNGSPEAARSDVLLYDGGTVDNLGVKTLLTLLNKSVERASLATAFPQGCLVIAVDATPRSGSENSQPLPASTVLLKSNRREVLERVGMPADQQDRARFSSFTVGRNGKQSDCRFWHLALRHLPDSDPLGAKVTRIATSLKIETGDQEALVAAAKRLVEEGREQAVRREDWAEFLRPSLTVP